MSLEGGSQNGSGEKRPKKVIRTPASLAQTGITKPLKGPSHKSERRHERTQQKNNLPQLTRSASLFKNEIDSELDTILRRAGIESGNISIELRREGTQFEIELEIKDTHIPDSFDLEYAANKIKSHIESDPRNPHGITVLVRISRARDKNKEALERGGPSSPHLNAEARREMMRKELEKMHDLLDKLAEQLKRDGFTPENKRREIYFRIARTKEGQEIYEVAIDNEDAPQSIQTTVQRLALIEPRILTGSRVLVQNPDGKVVIESRELGARVEGAAEKTGAAKESIDNLKAELFPKLRPRLKEFALAVGCTPLDTEEGRMLSRIVSVQMIEALDDILRLEKSSGKKGKEQARTNMIGGTSLFNRLQKLGLIDGLGSQVNQELLAIHIKGYLANGSDVKDNFIIALHNISARFQKVNRERAFPRTREALEKKMAELGLRLEYADVPKQEPKPETPWRLALGIHPDADGEGVPKVLRRPLGPNPNPVVTAEFAALLRDMDNVKKMEATADGTPAPASEEIVPILEEFASDIESLGASAGDPRATEGKDERTRELENLVAALQTQLTEANDSFAAAQNEIETLRTLSEQSGDALIDAHEKITLLTEDLQRTEAQKMLLDEFANEIRRISEDPQAILEMTKIVVEALQEIEK